MKKVNLFIIAATLFLLVGVTGVAQAGVYSFGDTSINWPGYNTSHPHQDVIGTPNIIGGAVNTDAMTLRIDLNIPHGTYNTYRDLGKGDLFLSVDGDSNWEYVLTKSGFNSWWNLYSVELPLASSDYDYSNNNGFYGADYREGHPVWADLDQSADFVGYASFLEEGGYSNRSLTWTLANFWGDTSGVDLSQLVIGFTFSCANDVLYENVNATPIPGAVWLFGSGLLGLIGVRSRKRKSA